MSFAFSRSSARRVSFLASLVLGAPWLGASESATVPSAGRVLGTFAGIECEFSVGQEELARQLAARFAAHNATVSAEQSKASPKPTIEALSPAEMRERRSEYLARIAAQLGLTTATPWQEECYDAFLGNYELTMETFESMRRAASELRVVRKFTLWPQDELVARLAAGEIIPGMQYDSQKKQGNSTFGLRPERVNSQLRDLTEARTRLRADYHLRMTIEDGARTYQGNVRRPNSNTRRKEQEKTSSPQSSHPAPLPTAFPVVVPTEWAEQSAELVAEKLWSEHNGGITGVLAKMNEFVARVPRVDPAIAGVVLHEVAEVGIVDRYLRSPDRRWFCDGVANYVGWRVMRDLHGSEMANLFYNLREQLTRHAAFRERVDLRKWRAVEMQSVEEENAPVNRAHYAYATHAVFLMTERAGEDVLPRLFTEIAKTSSRKVSMKTVEKAWTKLTGVKLEGILVAAVADPGTAAPDDQRPR
jgi:hypothetical protein